MPVDKVIDPNIAANAYMNTAKAGQGKSALESDDGVTFSELLKASTP